MEENRKCQFLYDIDLFGKNPDLYFKGKPKRSTELGVALTIIYIILYIAFLIYKLVRMVKRVDVTFYDTYAYKDFPYINITHEEFYGAFMLGTGIDETLYYPKGQFVYNVKTPTGFVVERSDELEVEVCDINKFGSRYRELFKDKNLDNLYCMKRVQGALEGYANLDRYSYISVQFYPCHNKTKDGRDCMPEEYLRAYLATNIIEFKMQDNLLSPEIYETPVQALEKDINTPVFFSMYQYIYSYIQIVILETDDDITGLNFWAESKVERYPKYDESYIITAPPNGDVIKNGGALCEVTLQLAAKVLTTKRKYMTLIDVLGDVGGLMEILYTFFNLIASFLTGVSYEKSLVNNLFYFDIDKTEINIKKKMRRNIKIKKEGNIESFSLSNNNPNQDKENESEKLDLFKNSLNLNANKNLEKDFENQKIESNDISISKGQAIRSKHKTKNTSSNYSVGNKVRKNETNRPIVNENFNESNDVKNENVEIYQRNTNTIRNNKEAIIKKIKMNVCCYCFLSKKKSIDVNLIDEGMKVITEKLDIMNLFVKLYGEEKIQEKLLNDLEGIQMSKDCKYNLKNIKKEKEKKNYDDNESNNE